MTERVRAKCLQDRVEGARDSGETSASAKRDVDSRDKIARRSLLRPEIDKITPREPAPAEGYPRIPRTPGYNVSLSDRISAGYLSRARIAVPSRLSALKFISRSNDVKHARSFQLARVYDRSPIVAERDRNRGKERRGSWRS